MNTPLDLSGNEIQALVLKAARGGDVPLGLAEDLAAAAQFLDLDALTECPCRGEPTQISMIATAFDQVAAGEGPQKVNADPALIAAYAQMIETHQHCTVDLTTYENGAKITAIEQTRPQVSHPLGRRLVPETLAHHLADMAAKTLVPETDASRLGGAGAGLTDND